MRLKWKRIATGWEAESRPYISIAPVRWRAWKSPSRIWWLSYGNATIAGLRSFADCKDRAERVVTLLDHMPPVGE
jgi:hypothetical protein